MVMAHSSSRSLLRIASDSNGSIRAAIFIQQDDEGGCFLFKATKRAVCSLRQLRGLSALDRHELRQPWCTLLTAGMHDGLKLIPAFRGVL